MSWTDLTDKVVIITGGAAGIGLAVAKGFIEVGAKVMIADFSEEAGQKAAYEASEAGPGEARFARCDVTQKADVDQMIQSTLDTFGSVDQRTHHVNRHVVTTCFRTDFIFFCAFFSPSTYNADKKHHNRSLLRIASCRASGNK